MTAAPLVRPGQRGTAIIEFAIALPLLLFLLLATAETGRLLSQYDTLNKAVRDAARYLATNALGGTTGVVSITPQLQTATANLVVQVFSVAQGRIVTEMHTSGFALGAIPVVLTQWVLQRALQPAVAPLISAVTSAH